MEKVFLNDICSRKNTGSHGEYYLLNEYMSVKLWNQDLPPWIHGAYMYVKAYRFSALILNGHWWGRISCKWCWWLTNGVGFGRIMVDYFEWVKWFVGWICHVEMKVYCFYMRFCPIDCFLLTIYIDGIEMSSSKRRIRFLTCKSISCLYSITHNHLQN